jgi:hypothetical protein
MRKVSTAVIRPTGIQTGTTFARSSPTAWTICPRMASPAPVIITAKM